MPKCSRMPTTSTEALKSLSISHGVFWVIKGEEVLASNMEHFRVWSTSMGTNQTWERTVNFAATKLHEKDYM